MKIFRPRVKIDKTEHCDRWIVQYYCSECRFVVKSNTTQCPNCKEYLKPYNINNKNAPY